MADSSTTNPSDPRSPGQPHPAGDQDPARAPAAAEQEPASPAEPAKLKLKKFLMPLSPHLKVPLEHHEDLPGKEQKHFESPHAVPVELEPDLPPPPPEEKLTAPSGPGFDQPLPDPEQANPETEPGTEPSGGGAKAGLDRKAGRPGNHRPKLLLATLGLVAGLLFLANHFLDPLGLRGDPIQPILTQRPAGEVRQADQAEIPEAISGGELYDRMEELTLDLYLEQLAKQKVHASMNPDGIFIGSAFVPLQGSVNPLLGLTLKSVGEREFVLVDEYLQAYSIPLD